MTELPSTHTASPTSPTFIQPSNQGPDSLDLGHTAVSIDASSPNPSSCRIIDFSSQIATLQSTATDSLTNAHYFKSHRRAERQEKHFRNIEKERAQHEKVQLERLLEGLQGPDWLRVMGISGITDGERKSWEGKRDWFMREVTVLIEKFRAWKEEERRRKVEKEPSDDEEEHEDTLPLVSANSKPPPSPQPIDALAARLLHVEVASATKSRVLMEIEKPFTSFFKKSHLRDAAINGHRRGRTAWAFGVPVPDFPRQTFELPKEFLTEGAIRSSARHVRRLKRERDIEGTVSRVG